MFSVQPTEHARKFKNIFGREFHDFWNIVYGFDIVKFDDEIVKSGDKSVKEVIQENYGEEAVNLILGILEFEQRDITRRIAARNSKLEEDI